MNKARLLACGIGLVCFAWGQPLPGQSTFGAEEAAALAAKQAGQYRRAGRLYVALLQASDGDARAAALAEYYASMAMAMARQAGDWDHLLPALDAVRTSPFGQTHGVLADHLAVLGLQAALACGNHAEVTRRTEELGFIQNWWLLGPLDNERGSGFGRTFAVEKSLDLAATIPGKKRPVRWRELPLRAIPGAQIDLDQLVRPNDQVLVYLTTCLQADQDCDVVLHAGSDEALQVFLNGQPLLVRDVRRRFAYDQDALTLPLRAGPNLLLVKVCELEGDFQFAARLAAPQGGRPKGVTVLGTAAALTAAARVEPAERQVPAPVLGARTVLQQSVDATQDGADAFRLAYLLTAIQPDDANHRRDRRLAELAAAALPDEPAARYLLAFTRAERDVRAEERDDNVRRHDYAQILAMAPDHVQAMLALAHLDLDNVGAAAAAENHLRRALAVNPTFVPARLMLAQALQARGLRALALHELTLGAALDGDGLFWPSARRELGAELLNRDDLRGARAVFEDALRLDWSPAAAVHVAKLQLRTGARDSAIALLQHTSELAPCARAPHELLWSLYSAEGAHEAALGVLRGWLALCPEDDAALVDVADQHGMLGQTEAQREALRAALDLNPNRKSEQRLLEFLEAGERPFFAGHEIAGDQVLAEDRGPPPDSKEQNDSHYWLLRQTVIRAYRNGTTSRYDHTIARVLNEAGARQLANHWVPHFHGEQRARLLDVRIIKQNGKQLRPPVRGPYVQLPSLAVGDAVEIRARIDDLAPSFFGDYFGLEHGFAAQDDAPCQRSALTVILDPGRHYELQVRGEVPAGVKTADAAGGATWVWDLQDLPRRRLEVRRPAPRESEPLVRITTYRDWHELSTWWWNLIRQQSEVTPAMRAKVQDLTSGLTDTRAKIAAIYGFVTTDVRYTAWEFGVHGYQPYTTPVIFERRHGDCKDKALLLNALLGEIGVEAHPVLIHAEPLRSADDLTLPLLHHFNHCISWLPPADDRPGLFLDGTATYHGLDMVPGMDQGAAVLVVRRGQGEIHTIPWTPPEANRTQIEATVDLDANGDARLALVEHTSGAPAVVVRQELGNEPGKRREKLERRFAQSLGKVLVTRVECTDLLDVGQVPRLDLELAVETLAARQSDGLVVKGVLEAEALTHLVQAEQRQLALLLGPPESAASVMRYRLPAGWAPVELPPPVELRSHLGSYTMRWSFGNGELRVERERRFAAPRIEPAEYATFRDFVFAIDQADRQVVLVRKEGAR